MMAKVIAEIGINHNGSLERALKMIEVAKTCGADVVKFQKRDVDLCYTKEELAAPCRSPWGETVEDKVRGRELSWDAFRAIDERCSELGVGWSSSCFDLRSLRELEEYFGRRLSFHKVPSCMATHRRFLEQVASYRRLTLISVGLARGLAEVEAIGSLFQSARCRFVLNVTTALYPCPQDRCRLLRIPALRGIVERWKHCEGVGYSGHEVGVLPSVIAAQLGASWIERHFTLDRSLYGADQSSSLEPEGLLRLCRDVRSLPEIIGNSADFRLLGDEKNPVPTLREDR